MFQIDVEGSSWKCEIHRGLVNCFRFTLGGPYGGEKIDVWASEVIAAHHTCDEMQGMIVASRALNVAELVEKINEFMGE